jgi:molybdenum cofactor cytidylyltransferase
LNKSGIIILAAGGSSRMGQSKQLLTINGKSLLIHSIETALGCRTSDVIVVLGANADLHKNEITSTAVDIVVNERWESGMGSSIKTGLSRLLSLNPEVSAVLIMLVDQPKVTTSHLTTLIQCLNDFTKSIVASFYGNAPGVPAIFSKDHFNEMLSMQDESGAKKIILRHPDKLLTIGFPEGSIDLDTPDDYSRYLDEK